MVFGSSLLGGSEGHLGLVWGRVVPVWAGLEEGARLWKPGMDGNDIIFVCYGDRALFGWRVRLGATCLLLTTCAFLGCRFASLPRLISGPSRAESRSNTLRLCALAASYIARIKAEADNRPPKCGRQHHFRPRLLLRPASH